MKITKMLEFVAISGALGLCAISAINSKRLLEEVIALKRHQKNIRDQLNNINDSVSYGQSNAFITAFKLGAESDYIDDSYIIDDPIGGYVLREHNGEIGVYNDDGELMYTVTKQVSGLDAAARQSLLLGIKAASKEEVSVIIDGLK